MTGIRIAAALLVREGHALLVHRRPERAAFPDRWGLAGGHVEPGEFPHQALNRECLEELGAQIRRPRRIPMTAHANVKMRGSLVTCWAGEPLNTAPEEHDEMAWLLPNEISGLTLAHPESLTDIPAGISSHQPHRHTSS